MVEYPLHQFVRLGSLEIHITITNCNIDVRMLAHGHVLPSLVYSKLDIEQDEIRKTLLIKGGNQMN